MKQCIRYNVFETNSSSIHALIIREDSSIKDFSNLELKIMPFKRKDLDDFGNVFTELKDKLRYLWTIRCLYEKYNEDELADEFTSLLRSICPKVDFVEIDEENIPYLEDYEYLINDPKFLDVNFIKQVLSDGEINFTSRDYNTRQEESFIDDLRQIEYNTPNLVVWSEG